MTYPAAHSGRDAFVLDRRPPRPAVDPWRHQGVVVEAERSEAGPVVDVATIFLTGRECPWRCVMCDLWRHTTVGDTPAAAIPRQVRDAVETLRASGSPPLQVKLYNAGSFFDPRAVPRQDDEAIAAALQGFARVIVESHPALVGDRTWRFQEMLAAHGTAAAAPVLEVAMGLETAHPEALERLHKRVTLDRFRDAAAALRRHGVALRAFVLVRPPFVPADEQDAWLRQSVAFAFECGAAVVSLIPTRGGNGAMEELARLGLFVAPRLRDLERGLASALPSAGGRVFADLWDLDRLAGCPACFDRRRARLQQMNREQRPAPAVRCDACREVAA